MKQDFYTITENKKLTKNVYLMKLSGDTSAITRPGQFINIQLEGRFLRRPISVCDCTEGEITILYKTVGGGTLQMSRMTPGQTLDVLTGLGNGFELSCSGDAPLLVGGGVGVPPMYLLCKKLLSAGKKPAVILGFNTKDEVFFEEEFKALGVKTTVTTVDGSYGVKGFVTDVMKQRRYSYFYTCGPMPMFRAIEACAVTSGQFSFEERMGCGFGACMGCSCRTKYGSKRICKDGPVLTREEIIW